MGRDFHNNFDAVTAIAPTAAVTNDTAFVSAILDTANHAANELIIQTGSLADADATFAVLLEEGDVSTLSDNAAVADADLLGTEALAGFTFAADNSTRKLGYIGSKRYIRATITPTGNTGNVYLSATWIQTGMRVSP